MNDSSNLQNKRVFLMAGYPGSGKSTLAKKIAHTFHASYISSDNLREKQFQSKRYDDRGDALIDSQRDRIYGQVGKLILEELKQHQTVIFDATNLEQQKREMLLEPLLEQIPAQQICFVCVKTPYKEIEKRVKQTNNSKYSETESLLDAWKRVYAIFQKKDEQGLLSWPQHKDIDTLSAEEMYEKLD